MRVRPKALFPFATTLALMAVLASCGPRASRFDDAPIDVSQEPRQAALEAPRRWQTTAGGFDLVVTAKASYVLGGLVLGRENYHGGWNASLSPCDVAMAWGDLVKDGLYRQLHWSQSGRWYWWEYGGGFKQDNAFVIRNSSNTHIIPADANLSRAARSLHGGDVAELSGDLVDLDGTRGDREVHWHSSMSRTDEGDGSCEVLYLTRVRVKGKVYE